MKPPLSKLVPELLRIADTARENAAATCLRADKVRSDVVDAAKGGQRRLRIKLPDGVDVRECVNTGEFLKWAKENGIAVEWVKRVATLPDGRTVDMFDAELSW